MNRRDILFGIGCVAALGTAEALRPRRVVSLMAGRKITRIIPARFAGWEAEGGGDMVRPKIEGSLADTLYNETVSRTYRHADGGAPVMLLAAHGDSQSDLLQLHRPEICYQAVGFEIDVPRAVTVPLVPGVTLPSVELTARAGTRMEDVLYWTRLGEYLPTSGSQQRSDRLRTAMSGVIADGVLVRCSSVRVGDQADWSRLQRFAADMVGAMAGKDRIALIGTERADRLAQGRASA